MKKQWLRFLKWLDFKIKSRLPPDELTYRVLNFPDGWRGEILKQRAVLIAQGYKPKYLLVGADEFRDIMLEKHQGSILNLGTCTDSLWGMKIVFFPFRSGPIEVLPDLERCATDEVPINRPGDHWTRPAAEQCDRIRGGA